MASALSPLGVLRALHPVLPARPGPRALRAGLALAACAGFALVLGLNSARYYPFLSDDALISLRYAQRLLDGHGLTWASGKPVEGYSNLLWILGVAGLGAFGVEPVSASRLLGALCMAVVAGALCRPMLARGSAAPAAGLCVLSCTGPVGAWTLGGLEQPLVAALLAVALVACFAGLEQPQALRPPRVAGLAFAGLCLTRPDGFLFGAVTASWLLLRGALGRSSRARAWLWVGAAPALAVLAQLGFRLAYYGEWLPNPARIKVAFTEERVEQGLRYVGEGLQDLSPLSELSLLAIVLGLVRGQRRAHFALLGANLWAWLGYVAVVGGDIFPARRHFVPVVVLMVLVLIEALEGLEQRLVEARAPHAATRAAPVLLGAGLALVLWFEQPARAAYREAMDERWEWDGEALGRMLRGAFADRGALVAVTAAGCIPYWSGLDAIDMLGLNDSVIARDRPADFGRGYIAHEHGNAKYVLDRQPDLIVFDVGGTPRFRVGEQLKRQARFSAGYQAVRFETKRPTRHSGWLYVRRDSPKIGIRQTAEGLHVPGFLLEGAQPTRAGKDGRLVGRVKAGDLAFVRLGRAAPSGPIEVRSRPEGAARAFVDRQRPEWLRVLVTSPPDKVVSIRELLIRRRTAR